MNYTINKLLDEIEKSNQIKIDDATSVRAALDGKASATHQQISRLEAEIKVKLDLISGMENEGVDPAPVKSRVEQISAQIAALSAQRDAFLKEGENVVLPPKQDLTRLRLLAGILESQFQCTEAIVVDSIDDCWAHLPTMITQCDGAGRPTECGIVIDAYNKTAHHYKHGIGVLKLKVNSYSERFVRSFRPKCVDWVPTEATAATAIIIGEDGFQEAQDDSIEAELIPGKYLAFFERQSSRLIVQETQMKWTTSKETVSNDWERRRYIERIENEDDFRDVATSLPEAIKAISSEANDNLDLACDYTSKPLLQRLKLMILDQTTDKPLFVPTSASLPSAEVYAKIKLDWDAMVTCPWSSEIDGVLARLKYYLENGERPRFWMQEYVNYFGFRVRTRDHNWIVGDIYISDSDEAHVAKPALIVIGSRHNSVKWFPVVRIGRMWMKIQIEE